MAESLGRMASGEIVAVSFYQQHSTREEELTSRAGEAEHLLSRPTRVQELDVLRPCDGARGSHGARLTSNQPDPLEAGDIRVDRRVRRVDHLTLAPISQLGEKAIEVALRLGMEVHLRLLDQNGSNVPSELTECLEDGDDQSALNTEAERFTWHLDATLAVRQTQRIQRVTGVNEPEANIDLLSRFTSEEAERPASGLSNHLLDPLKRGCTQRFDRDLVALAKRLLGGLACLELIAKLPPDRSQ
jgi:hypothetical protein